MTKQQSDLKQLLGNEGEALQELLFKYNTTIKDMDAKQASVDAMMTANYVIGELYRNQN